MSGQITCWRPGITPCMSWAYCALPRCRLTRLRRGESRLRHAVQTATCHSFACSMRTHDAGTGDRNSIVSRRRSARPSRNFCSLWPCAERLSNAISLSFTSYSQLGTGWVWQIALLPARLPNCWNVCRQRRQHCLLRADFLLTCHPSSRNAVSFSSARTTKRFPSPRCASATKIAQS